MINALELSHWNVGPREHEAVAVKGKLSVEPVGAGSAGAGLGLYLSRGVVN